MRLVVSVDAALSPDIATRTSDVFAEVARCAICDSREDTAALVHLHCWLDRHWLLLLDVILTHVRPWVTFALNHIVRFVALARLISRRISALV